MDSAQNEDVPDGSKYNLHNQVPLDRDGLWDTSSDFIDTVDDMPSMPQIGKNPGRSRKGGLVGSIEQTAENLTAIPELLDEVAQFGKKGLVAGGGTVMAIANKFIVEPVFGKDKVLADKFNVDPKKGITAKASKADLSKPENVGELVKVKEAMTKSKVVTPPTEEQIKMSEDNYSKQMAALNTKYKGIRRKSEAISNLYLSGLINESQLKNFSETKDIRYSAQDMVERAQKNTLFSLKTEKMGYDNGIRKAEFENLGTLTGQKLLDAQVAYRNKVFASVEKWGGIAILGSNVHPDYQDKTGAALKKATMTTFSLEKFTDAQLADPTFQSTIMTAMSLWIESGGAMRGDSFTPHLNTAKGSIRTTQAAQSIMKTADLEIVKGKYSVVEVRDSFDKFLMSATDKAGGSLDNKTFEKVIQDFEDNLINGRI
jgi:hypothetical protein